MRLIRGFTFIEACICIVTFSVLSALVFPHMVREASSREHRLFKKKLTAMVDKTRSRAIETQRTVALSFRQEDRSIEAMEQDQNQVSQRFPT